MNGVKSQGSLSLSFLYNCTISISLEYYGPANHQISFIDEEKRFDQNFAADERLGRGTLHWEGVVI